MPSRRQVLAAAAAAATPYVFSPRASFADGAAAPSDRISIGVIGCGGMGSGNISAAREWLDVVAVCDVDRQHAERFNQGLADGKATIHDDYREILDNDSIDTVHIATPDHWHAKPLIEAMRAGKDVYCEKPLTLTIAEGQLVKKVQEETGRVVQVGTQQRSTFDLFVKAVALVADGRLGRLKRVQAAIGGAPASEAIPAKEPSGDLDWDRWLGPAPLVACRFSGGGDKPWRCNFHNEFRWWYEYSGGKLTDWGAHHVDICNWALKANGQTDGPTGIRGSAEHPVQFDAFGHPLQTDRYNTATAFHFTLDYADGAEMIIRHDTDNGVLLEGDKGRIFVNRGKLVGAPVDELKDNPLPEDAITKLYRDAPVVHNERKAHWYNFLHAVREGTPVISDVHTHMNGLNLCHLAGISARLGRDLKWDDQTQSIPGDEIANAMISRTAREGYAIEA